MRWFKTKCSFLSDTKTIQIINMLLIRLSKMINNHNPVFLINADDRKGKLVVDNSDTLSKLPNEIGTDYNFKRRVVWFNAIGFLLMHLAALYGLYLVVFRARLYTSLWASFVAYTGGIGVTMGAHRLYSHRAFKATWPLKMILLILHTVSGQNCLYIWARDHRQHHKYSDTDADPHNANRGFFFSHIGWLMSRKHPAVISKGKTIDMSDIEADPLAMFQKTFYKPLYVVFAMAIPIAVPVAFWNETYYNSFFISYWLRYVIQLNATWLVNSAAHCFGIRPYDKKSLAVESAFVSFISSGEGWHNYHHTFPWDYRAAELGTKFSGTTKVIDFACYLGLAYDLKATPSKMIETRAGRTGDGSYFDYMSKLKDVNNNVSPEEEQETLLNNKKIDEIINSDKFETCLNGITNRKLIVQG